MDKLRKIINYSTKRSAKTNGMRLEVSLDGHVSVFASNFLSEKNIEDFVLKNYLWIIKKQKHFSKFKNKIIIRTSRDDYLACKEKARKLAKERVAYFNEFYQFKFNKIAIKNQKTLWGSCSINGNLNFNYAIVKLRSDLADYIIIHEMCHLWHFDHSRKFWELVRLAMPEYKEKRREIKALLFG